MALHIANRYNCCSPLTAKHEIMPEILPFGMRDVEVAVTITGTVAEILSELRALRPGNTSRSARIRAQTIQAQNRRQWEDYYLPEIVEGDIDRARDALDMLARERRISAETERKLDDIIGALVIITRRA